MALTALGRPFTSSAFYWIEDSYGVVTTPTLGKLPISCKIQNMRIDTGDRHKVLRDVGSPLACKLLKQTTEPKFHLEYVPQCNDTMIDDVIDRVGSCCTLQSQQMCIKINDCEASADDKSSYLIKGMKPETVRVTGSKNTEYLVVIDYQVQSIVTNCGTPGAAPAPLTGAYLQFNVAGEITKVGGHVVNVDHIAFCTNSIELTVTHKLTPYTDHDSLTKAYLIEGEMDIEGSVDITLDGGGAQHFAEVMANTAFDLQIDMGLTGCPRISLPNCEWKNSSVPMDIGGEAIMNSTPFTCKPSSCSLIVTAVP